MISSKSQLFQADNVQHRRSPASPSKAAGSSSADLSRELESESRGEESHVTASRPLLSHWRSKTFGDGSVIRYNRFLPISSSIEFTLHCWTPSDVVEFSFNLNDAHHLRLLVAARHLPSETSIVGRHDRYGTRKSLL